MQGPAAGGDGGWAAIRDNSIVSILPPIPPVFWSCWTGWVCYGITGFPPPFRACCAAADRISPPPSRRNAAENDGRSTHGHMTTASCRTFSRWSGGLPVADRRRSSQRKRPPIGGRLVLY